jgi:hypothetical protein
VAETLKGKVLVLLGKTLNDGNVYTYTQIKKLILQAGVSIPYANRLIEELEWYGVLERQNRGRYKFYRLRLKKAYGIWGEKVKEKMTQNEGAPNLASSIESLKQSITADDKYRYLEYLFRDLRLKEVLCFKGNMPKNLVYVRLDLVLKRLKPEWVVFRMIELGLYIPTVIDSYPIKECKEVCVEKQGRKCVKKETKCDYVNKDIEGVMPSEELAAVCSQSI